MSKGSNDQQYADLTGWPTVEVPVPDLLGERIPAQQMRELLRALGLGRDDGSVLGDWFGAVCDAVELTEWVAPNGR